MEAPAVKSDNLNKYAAITRKRCEIEQNLVACH